MKHNIKLFRPTSNTYEETESAMNFVALIIVVASTLATLFGWGTGPFGWETLPIGPVVGLFILLMTSTHQEKPLYRGSRKIWRQYNSLPVELQADIPLSIPALIKIQRDEDEIRRLEAAIDRLEVVNHNRKLAEIRLDSTARDVLESVYRVTDEQQEYIKVLESGK